METQAAVDRLNSQLPLKARQDKLSPQLKAAHQNVLYSLIKQGRPPTENELAQQIGKENVQAGLRTLGEADLIVLDAEGKHPLGAYPVTVETTPHKITVNGNTIHAMCALDAVSVAPMFDAEVHIESTCHVSNTPITIRMQDDNVLDAKPSFDVTVGIRWQMPLGSAAHSMCMEMVFLKDHQAAKAWQDGDTDNISLFSLPAAVAFGKAFFLSLLD
jgi:hypothetical protein